MESKRVEMIELSPVAVALLKPLSKEDKRGEAARAWVAYHSRNLRTIAQEEASRADRK